MTIYIILITYPDREQIVDLAYSEVGVQNTIDSYKQWFWEKRFIYSNYEDAKFVLFEKYLDLDTI